MSDLQQIQNLLKEVSELLQVENKTSKKKAVVKLRMIANVASTAALTLEVKK